MFFKSYKFIFFKKFFFGELAVKSRFQVQFLFEVISKFVQFTRVQMESPSKRRWQKPLHGKEYILKFILELELG